ncbi:MAG: hypothetical protein NTV97_03105 [Alphaproteobacteria bacterium]|nr:hypothetical protein [Alphaproteobacteria bacterium]
MAKAKYAEWVDLKAKVPRSSIATGLKQGLRETPRILHGFPDPIREHLLKAFQRILLEEAPDFFPDEGNKLVGIVKRGRIRNEDEYYLVRHRADEIEGRVAHEDEVAVLLRLLDGYEGVR